MKKDSDSNQSIYPKAIKKVYNKTGLSLHDSRCAVEAVMESLLELFAEKKSVYLNGIGTFELRIIKAHKRKFMDGMLELPDREHWSFSPSRKLKRMLERPNGKLSKDPTSAIWYNKKARGSNNQRARSKNQSGNTQPELGALVGKEKPPINT